MDESLKEVKRDYEMWCRNKEGMTPISIGYEFGVPLLVVESAIRKVNKRIKQLNEEGG